MAFGGGTFTVQNKLLPGAYINFVSASRASATLSDRGYVALALELDWGPEGEVFTVEAGQLQKDCLKIFGCAYTDDRLKGLRDLFLNARTAYLYRLNSGGVKAANLFAQANHPGLRGNDLRIQIAQAEGSTEEAPLYEVTTWLDRTRVDSQTVSAASGLAANTYVSFKADAALAVTASAPLTGGTNGTVEDASYEAFLEKIEGYSFNVLGCLSTDDPVKALFTAFTKRMRDEEGVKFQTVLYQYHKADYEGVISVENKALGGARESALVYWTAGAQAGCAVNRSVGNQVYHGEYEVEASFTQSRLKEGLKTGQFLFHKVDGEVRVLSDINTFVTATDEKSADFSSNQTVRVLDQVGNDIAALFNSKYCDRIQNDDSGRISLWNDIVKHHEQLQTIRAIENFSPEQVTVSRGDTKKSVVVTDKVTPVNAMAQLYMTVVVA